MKTGNAATRQPVESLAFSIEKFCEAYDISRPTLYKLWAEGNGPEFMQVGRRKIIPVEASNAWRQRMTQRAEVNHA
jgi:hypothetical protein